MLSHVTVFELPMYHKLLVVSDVAVIPYPDLSQKTAIVRYLTATAKVLGVERPKIAAIAPSEQLLASVQSSVEAAVLAKMADRGQLGDVVWMVPWRWMWRCSKRWPVRNASPARWPEMPIAC
ncbi:MAG: phosphate acyltransferase [Alistipes indistinctus]